MGNGKFYRDNNGVIGIPKEILSDEKLSPETIGVIALILYYFENSDSIPTDILLKRLKIDEVKLRNYFSLMIKYGYYIHVDDSEEE